MKVDTLNQERCAARFPLIATGLVLLSAAIALLAGPAVQAQASPAYARTAAEKAAGVTPKNLEFPPDDIGMLERYGAVGDGVANDDDAIQAAIKVAQQGSQTIYLKQGKTYRYTTPIVLSSEQGLRNIVAPNLPAKSPFSISPKVLYDGPKGTFAIDSDAKGTVSHCLLQGFNLTFVEHQSRGGIDFDNVAFSTVRGVHVYQADVAFRTARSWNMLLIDTHFTDSRIGWQVDRELNASAVVNARFNRNGTGIRLNATISGLAFLSGSIDNNDIGVLQAGRHIDWIKFDGTYLENNRIGVSHRGNASASNWIWSSYFQHLSRSETWYEIDTSGEVNLSFRDNTIDRQPSSGPKRLIDLRNGRVDMVMDNLILLNGASFKGSAGDWKPSVRFSGARGKPSLDIASRPDLLSGWKDADPVKPLIIWRDGDGDVRIRGVLEHSSVTAGAILRLPDGYQPENRMVLPVVISAGTNSQTPGVLEIQPSGTVSLTGDGASGVFLDVEFSR